MGWVEPETVDVIAEPAGPTVRVLDAKGKRVPVVSTLAAYDSMMTHATDPQGARELMVMRERMRGWRFYDHFRTDREALARFAEVGTRTPPLSSDGSDVAAALCTIREIGDGEALDEEIADAFPGAEIVVETASGLFEVRMRQRGLLRPLRDAELSDGTLRYILLVAALLSPCPPPLLVLNEPETSLHPDLLAPLARLIGEAAKSTQIIVVSHAPLLVGELRTQPECSVFGLSKELGETVIPGINRPPWAWPSR